MKIKELFEYGVGYIAKNKKEANDPRYSMSITKDVKPGEVERQAKKFGNKVPPPLLHSSAAKNSTPNKLMNLGLTESVIDEARGLFARNPGDPYVDDKGIEYEFQSIVTYPKQGNYANPTQFKQALNKINAQIPNIIWTNAEGKNLSFAVASFTRGKDSKVYGRFFPKIEPNGGMLKKWQNTDLPGLRYQSAPAKKEKSGLKPQQLLKNKTTFANGSELLNYILSMPDISNSIKQGLAMIGQGKMPVFIGEEENLPTIRDNLGEIIQILCLTHSLVDSSDADNAKKEVLLGADFSECSIEFPEGETSGLVDSYLYANGRKLGISSKGNKGANASMKNLTDTLEANPTVRKKVAKSFPLTIKVLEIINTNSAKEGPLALAVELKLINQKNANEVRALIANRVTKENMLSDWAKKYVKKYNSEKKIGWNYGNWILANIAKEVAIKLNSDADFNKGCLTILNNAGILQIYSNAAIKGGNVVFNAFRVVYPPKFTGHVYMDAGKNYFASDQKGKLSFGFSKPKDKEVDEPVVVKKKKPVPITARNPKLKSAPVGAGRSKRK